MGKRQGLDRLPPEIATHIILFLGNGELRSLLRCSRTWYRLVKRACRDRASVMIRQEERAYKEMEVLRSMYQGGARDPRVPWKAPRYAFARYLASLHTWLCPHRDARRSPLYRFGPYAGFRMFLVNDEMGQQVRLWRFEGGLHATVTLGRNKKLRSVRLSSDADDRSICPVRKLAHGVHCAYSDNVEYRVLPAAAAASDNNALPRRPAGPNEAMNLGERVARIGVRRGPDPAYHTSIRSNSEPGHFDVDIPIAAWTTHVIPTGHHIRVFSLAPSAVDGHLQEAAAAIAANIDALVDAFVRAGFLTPVPVPVQTGGSLQRSLVAFPSE
jgi:hypothetical protein